MVSISHQIVVLEVRVLFVVDEEVTDLPMPRVM
jgi:hypothetical protein